MKFSLILPTRDRHALFQRCIASIYSHTAKKNEIEILVICDNDDPGSTLYAQDAIRQYPALNMKLLMRDRSEFSNRDYYNWAADQSSGELVWIFADDLEIVKFNWDVVIWDGYQHAKKTRPDNCLCLNIRDNTPVPRHDMPKFPCFPMFTRECRNLFDWYLHPAPPNWGTDYICYQIFQPLDRLIPFQDDNFINHISYHTHQVETDETGLRIGRIFNRLKMRPEHNTDRILSEEVPKLREKLQKHINSFFENKVMPPLWQEGSK